MTDELLNIVRPLEKTLAELAQRRNTSSVANDVYESLDDCLRLARHAIENDTRIDYPTRVRGELESLRHLEGCHVLDLQVINILGNIKKALSIVARIEPATGGHLGTLTAIRKHFSFVEECGFAIRDLKPTGLIFFSEHVHLDLAYARAPYLSCSFGREGGSDDNFWVDDLLFMHGDERYRSLPRNLQLNTEDEVDAWFCFLGEIFRQYGEPIIKDEPGVFLQLAAAQLTKDAEIIRKSEQASKS